MDRPRPIAGAAPGLRVSRPVLVLPLWILALVACAEHAPTPLQPSPATPAPAASGSSAPPPAPISAGRETPESAGAESPVVLMPKAQPDASVTPAHTSTPETDDAGPIDPPAHADPDAGAGDAPQFPPFETAGPPIAARDRIWTYVEFPDTRCRDGSAAGISVSLNSTSKKVMIFLEGGVYCFDVLTCAVSPVNVDDTLFNSAKVEPSSGVFDLRNQRNPVRDWNLVYVPYCTGDAMGGTKPAPTDVPDGPAQQYFMGHLNMQKFLQRIVPTFADATDVLLTGMSAGGSSVLQNLVLVQRAFPKLKVRHINDSSLPPGSKAVLSECLQEKMRKLWGLDQSSLAYCAGSCPHPNDYWQDNNLFLAKLFADRPAGFIDAIEDGSMRAVCGAGMRDCTGSILFDGISAELYHSELLAYRDKLKPFPNYATFFPQGEQHTWLKSDGFYTGQAGGVKLVDWFAKIANGEVPGHAGP